MMEASKTPGKSSDDRTSVTPLPKDSAAHGITTGDKASGSNDSTECELGLVRVTDHVVSIDTWKGQLDFERACTAAVPGERCWLSGELTSWNRVLYSLEYELVETRPGFNRLKKADCYDCYSNKSVEDVAGEAAFLMSWLLEHHFCIEEFSLFCPWQFVYEAPPTVPSPIRLSPSAGSNTNRYFRHLKIEIAGPRCGNSVTDDHIGYLFALEGLNTVCGVEKLEMTSSSITFKFAAELESLLRRNASTLKVVKMTKAILPRSVDYALRCLVNCESLTLCPQFTRGCRVPNLASVAQLLRTTSALKNLDIYICPIKRQKQTTTIGEAVKDNASLTKLSVCSEKVSYSPEPIFAALQANSTLKELQLQKCNFNVYSGQVLANALCMNTSLRSLRITESAISPDSMRLLAGALKVNSTLEEIELSSRQSLYYGGIVLLCFSLVKNKTLKKLTLGKFRADEVEREVLARMLAKNDSYGRVQLLWANPDVNGLWSTLISPITCPKEVRLDNIRNLSKGRLGRLFDAIASSECVRTFRASWEGNVRKKGAAFCEMLKSNRSIRTLDIFIGDFNGSLTQNIFHALAENKGITKVVVDMESTSEETATAISYFLARNKTATAFHMTVCHTLETKFMKEFSKGMWQNRFIVDFELGAYSFCYDENFTVFEAVRRNKATLNRAVDFILRHKADRECAEAFELLSRAPHLVSYAVKVTGKTEDEVLAGMVSAANFLTDNYLTITGVVQYPVECHPAEGTQIAALNRDCWHAICSHLKVTDVLVPL